MALSNVELRILSDVFRNISKLVVDFVMAAFLNEIQIIDWVHFVGLSMGRYASVVSIVVASN